MTPQTIAAAVAARAPDPTGPSNLRVLVEADGTVREVSAGTAALIGGFDGPFDGDDLGHRLDQLEAPAVAAAYQRVAEGHTRRERVVVRFADSTGRWRRLDVCITNQLDDPDVAAIVIEGHDATESWSAEVAGRLEERLLQGVPVPVCVSDDRGVLVWWNDRAAEALGDPPGGAIGRTVNDLGFVPSDETIRAELVQAVETVGHWEGEYTIRDAGGRQVPVQATIDRIEDPVIGFTGYVAAWLDVSERRRLEGDLAFQALLDPLTGLAGNRLFVENLGAALHRARQSGTYLAVLYLGIDGFRGVNERFGHAVADQILVAFTEQVGAALAPGDVFARIGGDEFAVACEHLPDPAAAFGLAVRCKAALQVPMEVEGRTVSLTACLGVAVSDGDDEASALVRQADAAMDLAKGHGRGVIEMIDAELNEALQRRKATARELEAALADGQLLPVFHPIFDLRTGLLVGFEALARWDHPLEGRRMPADFIPVAEELGLIGALGHQMLLGACAALARFADLAPERPIKVAVNVAPQQLLDPGFPAAVEAALRDAGMPPARLTIEITESALEDHAAAADALRQLKAIGVELAIDDFGTGYSSLDRLRYFPIDHLKIDRSFVAGMVRRAEDELIVGTILALGQGLGLEVVAEGVETPEQVALLVRMGCDYAQGHLVGEPMGVDDAADLVASGPALGEIASGWRPPATSPRLSSSDITAESAIAMLSHELASPLTVLAGYSDILRRSADPTDHKLALEAISRASDQITATIDLVRDTADSDAGRLRVAPRPVPLAYVVDDALAGCRHRFALPIETELVEVCLPLDARRFSSALANVVANAAKHAGPEPRVRLVAVEHLRTVELHVIDDGPGVPTDKQGLIFRRFGRANRRVTGTGLGLYVARAVARAHGGDLRYQHAPGGGADFVFELPKLPT